MKLTLFRRQLSQTPIQRFYSTTISTTISLTVFLCLSLLLAACGNNSGAATSTGLKVQLAAAPEGRNGNYLTVALQDKDGKPVTDAKVSLEGNMTHAGMAPVIADNIGDDADGAVDGSYQVPFAFNMAGDWVVTVVVERNGQTETHDIKVNVGETDVTITGN